MKKFLLYVLLLVLQLPCQLNAEIHKPTILITAATGSFGEATSNMLAKEGYDLVISGRDQQQLLQLEKKLEAEHTKTKIKTIIIDFSDVKTIEQAASQLTKLQLGGIVLIGPRPNLSKKGIPSKEEWDKAFLEGFTGPLEVIRLFGAQIENNGSIVVMSGSTSLNYMPNFPNSNVIRLAWLAEVKNLLYHFAERKIRVNAISPGPILTPYHQERITKKAATNNISFEEQLAKSADSIPLKTYGKTEDVANLVSFLLSDKSAHLNGANIPLDGGESTAY